ncbi:hypothetical protein NM688_g4439 [Phlebia brevispora]|uniref:Uncharacterized protein n=1 Tax=Phlebia brevispora TaxID=194682 RepID=A0ACC1T3A5_9APHY|nr:hypothetical protein NM688_g4439 [Phlebia brevispora]
MHPVQEYRQHVSGGGSRKGQFAVRFVRQYPVVAGCWDGLYDDDVVKYVGEADSNDLEEHGRRSAHVVVDVCIATLADNLSRASLSVLCRRHCILDGLRRRSFQQLHEAVKEHRCTGDCRKRGVVFERPKNSAVNPFHVHQGVVDDATDTADYGTESCATFPPEVLNKSALADIARDWCWELRDDALGEGACAVCGQLTVKREHRAVCISDPLLDVLCVDGVTRTERDSVEDTCGQEPGPVLCRAVCTEDQQRCMVCRECDRALRRKMVPKLALANGLWLGEVPPCLTKLNFVEQLTVARYRHNACIVKVHKGGYKLSANAIVFSQPVVRLHAMLPPPSHEMDEMLAILFTGPTAPLLSDFKRTPFIV